MIAIGDLPHSVHQFLRFKATADYADNQNRISILKIRFILSKFRAAPQSKRDGIHGWKILVAAAVSASRTDSSRGKPDAGYQNVSSNVAGDTPATTEKPKPLTFRAFQLVSKLLFAQL